MLRACATVLLLFSASLWGGASVQIRVAHANARAEPNPSAQIVAVLNSGETFSVAEDVPYWYGVTLSNGDTAYVAKSLCKVVLEEEGENTEEEAGQPMSELYAVPPVGAMVTLSNCSPTTLSANFTICPREGTPGSAHAAANILKNRVARQCSFGTITVAQVLKLKALPGNVRELPASDPRKTYLTALEARPVMLEGFLAMEKNGGEESVNCGSSTRKDIHMEIVGTDTDDPKSNRDAHVVTEVTPWFREAITAWSTTSLGQFASYRSGYSGTNQQSPGRIRVFGWLFYDNPHAGDGSVGTWRGTAWEVHPITRIEVFDNGQWRSIE